MNDMSRRGFLRSFVPKVEVAKASPDPQQVGLGHLTAFPVHSTTRIRLRENSFVIESLPEGLRFVNSATNEVHALKLEKGGQVVGDLTEKWPAYSVLSILTGEMYILSRSDYV